MIRTLRKNYMANFAKPGGPGAKLISVVDKLQKSMGLPKGAKEELGITGEEGLKIEE